MAVKNQNTPKPLIATQALRTSVVKKTERQTRSSAFGAGLIALDLIINADTSSSFRAHAGGTCGNILTILAYLGWIPIQSRGWATMPHPRLCAPI